MMISDEQARLAARILRKTWNTPAGAPNVVGVDPELLERVNRALEGTPETSAERIAMGREMLDRPPSSAQVAGKILGRLVSDSLR